MTRTLLRCLLPLSLLCGAAPAWALTSASANLTVTVVIPEIVRVRMDESGVRVSTNVRSQPRAWDCSVTHVEGAPVLKAPIELFGAPCTVRKVTQQAAAAEGSFNGLTFVQP